MWFRKLASHTLAVINQVSRVAGITVIIFLLVMMLVTVLDVILRYVFNSPVLGSLEITEYLAIIVGFLGLAWCAVKGGHVKVDLVVRHLPPRSQAITDVVTMMLALTVVPFIIWQSFAQARYAQLQGTVSDILEIPAYPFYMVVGVGFFLLLLVMLTVLAESIGRTIKK